LRARRRSRYWPGLRPVPCSGLKRGIEDARGFLPRIRGM
jgi:hypothetical protein